MICDRVLGSISYRTICTQRMQLPEEDLLLLSYTCFDTGTVTVRLIRFQVLERILETHHCHHSRHFAKITCGEKLPMELCITTTNSSMDMWCHLRFCISTMTKSRMQLLEVNFNSFRPLWHRKLILIYFTQRRKSTVPPWKCTEQLTPPRAVPKITTTRSSKCMTWCHLRFSISTMTRPNFESVVRTLLNICRMSRTRNVK